MPPETNATSLGFVNTLNTVGGIIAVILIGYLLDMQWDGVMANGKHVYTTMDYHSALFILPCALVAAFITLIFVKETFCKPAIPAGENES